MEGTPSPETDIRLIDTPEKLDEILPTLRQATELGLDLEFDQNRHTYGFTLCLVQIGDGHTCYLIDPLRIADLEPIWNLVEDPAITKILHHANNDLLLLSKLGCTPRQILDTDVAAKIVDYEKTSLANMLAEEFGIVLNKAMQSSNWNLRPLSEEQIQYAALDVRHLLPLKERLVGRIEELGRQKWLREESHLLERIAYVVPEEPHLRLKGAHRLSPFQTAILKEIYAYRESLAQHLNKPAGQVISNEALLDLVCHPHTDVHEWVNHTKGIHRRLKQERHSNTLRQVVRKAVAEAEAANLSHDYPDTRWRRPTDTPESLQREEEAKKLQTTLAERYGTNASRLLVNQTMLQHYIHQGELPISKAYARDIINEVATGLGLDVRAKPTIVGL